MKTLLKNVFLHINGKRKKVSILIEKGKIRKIFNQNTNFASEGIDFFDAKGFDLYPGIFDIHFHGTGKYDISLCDESDLLKMEKLLAMKGITSYLATLYSLPYEKYEERLGFFKNFIRKNKKYSILEGVNLEGPFLNKEKKGSHNVKYLSDGYSKKFINLIKKYKEIIKIITVSPEIKSGLKIIKTLSESGIKVMIGHTNAGFDLSKKAFENGAKGITHIFNRLKKFHHRDTGTVGAFYLSDRKIYAEVIPDGIHLSIDCLRFLLKTADKSRLIFISDEIPNKKEYRVARKKGAKAYYLKNGVLAGSGTGIYEGIKMLSGLGYFSFNELWKMGSENPSYFLNVKSGKIKEGYNADMILLDKDKNIRCVFKRGELICAV